MGKASAEASGFVDTFTKCSGGHCLPDVQLATQVSSAGNAIDLSANVDPKFGSEELPPVRSGTEGKALGGGDSRSNAVKVVESLTVGCDGPLDVLISEPDDEEVVRQAAWYHMHGSHVFGPWCEEEGDHGHAPGASLGDTTGVEVGNAEPSSKRVVVIQALVEVGISTERAGGEAREGEEVDEEVQLDLIETLDNV